MANVLFVCKQNAGRSQIAEALFRQATNGPHQARSAGTQPAEQVHPVVVEAMRELNLDLSRRRPQRLTDELSTWADVVVTMGCGDDCPYIPGKTYIDWDLKDPADEPLEVVRSIRDEIGSQVENLVLQLDSAPQPVRRPPPRG